MPINLIMPKIGLNMIEGQINEWTVKECQSVKKGEILYVVETDKVTNDIESPQDGILLKILVPEGKVVPVRSIVGILANEGEKIDLKEYIKELEQVQHDFQKKKPKIKENRQNKIHNSSANTSGGILASPLAKRLAAKSGINLENIKGSGSGGRISVEDVEKAIAEKQFDNDQPLLPGKLIPLEGRRKVIAERVGRAYQEIPMVTLQSEIDVTQIVEYRERKKKGKYKDDVPSYNAILAYLAARGLKEFPYLNATLTDRGIKLFDPVNIGFAVDTEDGLTVVVVQNVDKRSILEIHKKLLKLTARALEHRSKPEDLAGGTFTISNLGMYGVDGFTPIINPSEVGILGVGRFVKKNDKFKSVFSLVFDHRVIDGAPAAKFLQKLGGLINNL